jgi:hypothetical protein
MPFSGKLIITIILTGLLTATEINANILITNGLTHEKNLFPGEKTTETIQLQNASSQVKSVSIYLTDYWFTHNGESLYDAPGTVPRSNAKWIILSQVFITMQPGETRSVDFEVNVPDIDTLNGSFWSVIMIEGVAPPDTNRQENSITISTVLRYAVQVVTNIGNTGNRDLEFLQFNMTKSEGIPYLEAFLKNTGERALRPELGVELFDGNGNPQGIRKADRKRLYPGTSVKISIPLEAILPGKYKGIVIADCDDDYIFGSEVSIDL